MTVMSTTKTTGVGIERSKTRCPDDVDRFVSAQIRNRRNTLGMSQDNLARRLGISFQQLQKYESGTNRVSCGRLYDIAAVMGMTVTSFFPPQGTRMKAKRLDELQDAD